jgi:hypothetical protein
MNSFQDINQQRNKGVWVETSFIILSATPGLARKKQCPLTAQRTIYRHLQELTVDLDYITFRRGETEQEWRDKRGVGEREKKKHIYIYHVMWGHGGKLIRALSRHISFRALRFIGGIHSFPQTYIWPPEVSAEKGEKYCLDLDEIYAAPYGLLQGKKRVTYRRGRVK